MNGDVDVWEEKLVRKDVREVNKARSLRKLNLDSRNGGSH